MASPPPLEYVDVQPLLDRVCGGLAPGELLAAEGFSLHDAMTAIEIGDLKMDFGHRTEEVASAEELIAAGQAPTELPVPQLLALLDRLLAMEATWHTGSMLPLTVFTSLYMLDTDRWATHDSTSPADGGATCTSNRFCFIAAHSTAPSP